ncbi:protein Mpv17-like isoform X2 [Actinia tenebrosa]|uniref:Mitochondrial inner membrane protein Mpv17 n=1 Tax=Actinia tenebrosa TaxID=6105 RepID=A0A6P8HN46_ACTTE|nr:protein Mpv17-like isoform X2 [Actinia tenebrosa]
MEVVSEDTHITSLENTNIDRTLVATGDVITQQLIEKKGTKHDVTRTVRMGVVGLCLGPILRAWYLTLDKVVVASSRPKLDGLKKMLLDQALFAPVCIGFFYCVSEMLSGKTFSQCKETLKERYVETLIANYKLWPAAQIVNFTFVPLEHRVGFVQIVAIFWNTYLAWMVNKPSELEQARLDQEKKKQKPL